MSVNLSQFRPKSEYGPVLYEMFLAYLKSDDFGTLGKEERIKAVDCYDELKEMITSDKFELSDQIKQEDTE